MQQDAPSATGDAAVDAALAELTTLEAKGLPDLTRATFSSAEGRRFADLG